MKATTRRATSLIALLLIAGCHPRPPAQAGLTAWTTPDGSARFSLSPFPPRSLDKSDLALSLHDANGVAIREAPVTVSATMPSMAMPPIRVDLKPFHNHYTGQIQFSMAGAWRLEVGVAGKSGPVGRHTIDIHVQ